MRDRFVLKGPVERKEGGVYQKEPNPEPEPNETSESETETHPTISRPVRRDESENTTIPRPVTRDEFENLEEGWALEIIMRDARKRRQ
jgi:hypothetical protein